MEGRQESRWVDYSIEGSHGTYRVRFRDAQGEEHVEEFATKTAALEYVQGLRRWPGDGPPRPF